MLIVQSAQGQQQRSEILKEPLKPAGSSLPHGRRDSTLTIEHGSSHFNAVRTKEIKIPLPVSVTLSPP